MVIFAQGMYSLSDRDMAVQIHIRRRYNYAVETGQTHSVVLCEHTNYQWVPKLKIREQLQRNIRVNCESVLKFVRAQMCETRVKEAQQIWFHSAHNIVVNLVALIHFRAPLSSPPLFLYYSAVFLAITL